MPLLELYEIFRTQPRHAEPADTKQAIQRRPARDHGKKQDRKTGADDSLFGEDRMSVSVESLQAFFTNLLQEQQQENRHETPEQAARPLQNESPAAQAVEAYRHAAETTPHSAPAVPEAGGEIKRPHEPDKIDTDSGTATQEPSKAPEETVLGKADREKIRDLLGLLDKLAEKRVAEITLRPAPRFLDSVENAIRTYL